MRGLKVAVLAAFFLIILSTFAFPAIPPGGDDPPVSGLGTGNGSQCGTMNESITLSSDISATGTCFIINASNIVIDGGGYGLTGDGGSSDYGIDNTAGYDNITIKNFGLINNFGNGIRAAGMVNSSIVNNTINSTTGSSFLGIYLYSVSDNNTITGNNVTVWTTGSSGDSSVAIASFNSVDNMITSNLLSFFGTGNFKGIMLSSGDNSTASQNTIDIQPSLSTAPGSMSGIYVTTSSNVTLTSNAVSGMSTGSSSSEFSGINISWDTSNSQVVSNTITISSNYSSGLTINGNDNIISSNTVVTTGLFSRGICLSMWSFYGEGNTFTDDVVNSTGVQFGPCLSGGILHDNPVTSLILMGSVNFTSHLMNNMSLNVSTNPPADPDGRINLSIWLEIISTSSPSSIDFNLTYLDSAVTNFPENSVQLYKSTGGWWYPQSSTNDTSSNIVSSGTLTSTALYALFGTNYTGCGVIEEDVTIDRNLTSTDDCFLIWNSNIILNGNGYSITCADSSCSNGVYNSGPDNVTIKNFAGIINYTDGIDVISSDGSTVYNNTIDTSRSSSRGISLDTCQDTTVSNNIVITRASSSPGISLISSDYSIIESNTVTTVNSSQSRTIVLSSSDYNNLSRNSVNATTDAGIFQTSSYEISVKDNSTGNSYTNENLADLVNFTSHSLSNVGIYVNTSRESPFLPGDPIGKQNLSKWLTILTESGGLDSYIDFNITYSDADYGSGDESTIRFYHYDGSNWNLVPTSSVDTASNTVRSGNVSPTYTFLYAVMSGDLSYPWYWADVNVTPTYFDTSATVNFSINWTDDSNITSVGIEINRSGTLILYTWDGLSTSTDRFNLTLTDFPAGTHYWRSNASDLSGNVNTTPWYPFTIAKVTPTLNLTLNGTAGPITIAASDTSISLIGSVITGDSGVVLNLTLNGVSMVNNVTPFSNPGVYNVSTQYDSSQNYSSANLSYLLTVFPATDACGNITQSTTLTSNIQASGTCFTIMASNVMLDGAGYSITGIGTSGYGVDNEGGYDNITIKNFRGINNFTIGINAVGMENSTISNNTLLSSVQQASHSVRLYNSSDYNIVTSNNFTSISNEGPASNGGYGVHIFQSAFNNITENVMFSTGPSGYGAFLDSAVGTYFWANSIQTTNSTAGHGIVLGNRMSNSTLILNNTIRCTGGGAGNGIMFAMGADSVEIRRNNIYVSGSSNAHGILFDNIMGNTMPVHINITVSNNTLNVSSSTYAIQSKSPGSTQMTVSSNTLYLGQNSAGGIYFEEIASSIISSNTFYLEGGNALYLSTNTNAVNVSSNTYVNFSTDILIHVNSDSYGNVFSMENMPGNLTFTSTGIRGISMYLNNTPAADPDGKQNISYYLHFRNMSSDSFINFNITYLETDVSGLDESSVRMHRYNGADWIPLGDSTSLNIANNNVGSGNRSSNFIYPYGLFAKNYTSCGTLLESATLDRDFNFSGGTCFTIGADNVVLDGNGYTIRCTGGGCNYGIYDSGYDNITVKNFAGINNFTLGVYISGGTNSTFFNNTILCANVSKSSGIYLTLAATGNNISMNTLEVYGDNSTGIDLNINSFSYLTVNTILTFGFNSTGIDQSSTPLSSEGSSNVVLQSGDNSRALCLNACYATNAEFLSDELNSTLGPELEVVGDNSCHGNNIVNAIILMGLINFTSHSMNTISVDVNTTAPINPVGLQNLSDWLTISNSTFNVAQSFIDFNLSYIDSEVQYFNESTIRLYYYNSTHNWTLVNSSSYDASSNYLRSGNLSGNWGLYGAFGVGDLTAPVVSTHTPSGTVTSAPATLTVTTNEAGTCRYSGSSGKAYENMSAMTTSGSTSHTLTTGIATYATYTYYIKCNNTYGKVATSDYTASFTYSAANDGGGGGGGGGGGVVILPPEVQEVIEELIEDGTLPTADGSNEDWRLCSGNNVMICHHATDHWQELCVAPSSVEMHFEHGDYLGKCIQEREEGAEEEDVTMYQIVENILANIPVDVPVNRPDTSLQKLTIEITEDYTRIELIFKTTKAPPADVTPPANKKIKHYIEVDHPKLNESDVKDTIIDFKVEKDWLEQFNATADKIVLVRHKNSVWNELETRAVNEDDTYHYYEADSPGLSVFAIALQTPPEQPIPTGGVTGGSTFVLPSFIRDYLPIVMTFVVMVFITMLGGFYYVYIRKQLVVKAIEKKKAESIYIFPHMDHLPQSKYAYVGLIADTEVQTYLDHKQLNLHTLIAGGTGSGKTIAGMVVVEELLKKREGAVIVFDPVGQWSGFLEKNKDKCMTEHFKRFKMTAGKAFKVNILEITPATMDLDILHYMKHKGLTILKLDKLKPAEMDQFIEHSLDKIYRARLPEHNTMKSLIVLDEVHRLIPKYGGKTAHIKLEQAVREFRKWGVGLLLISQVLTDFKGAIRGNIGTEIQMRTRYEGDIHRVKERHGSKVSQLTSKLPVGTGMVESVGYNKGSPYFVEFRPILHRPTKLTDKELEKYLNKSKPVLRTVPQDLIKYIKQCQAKGMKDADVRKLLKKANWDDMYVDRVLGKDKKAPAKKKAPTKKAKK